MQDGVDGVVVLLLGWCVGVTGGAATARTFGSAPRLHKETIRWFRVMRQGKGKGIG